MPAKRKSHGPSELAPDQCRDEIVAVLAAGLVRLISAEQPHVPRPAAPANVSAENLSESAETGLELPGETRLGAGRLTARETERCMAAKNDAADLANEIDALRRMTVKELRRRHVELFGEETRAGNRQYLFRRIAWRLQALAEGDLTERARRRARELARDADLRTRPPHEQVGPALRKEVRMYPEIAIRELVANAIIHQDFAMTGTGPMVEIFTDRIEITNPGKPLVDPMRFIDSPPQSRNEALAAFMRRINICEERGSGIGKVIFEVELFQLPPPDFAVVEEHTKAALFAYKKLADMDKNERLRACYQHACLCWVSKQSMTNATLRKRFAISDENYPVASRIISDAIDAGLIRPFDPNSTSKRHARYVPFWG